MANIAADPSGLRSPSLGKGRIVPTPDEQVLIDAIRKEMEEGKQEIHAVVEDVRTRRYWNIGQHIKTHLLKNEDRADYGSHLFELLEQETSIERSTLHRTVKFFEAYPEIVGTCPQLSWSHFRVLITVADMDRRKALEEKTVSEKLNVKALKAVVRAAHPELNHLLPLTEHRDKPNVYQLREVRGRDVVDLGFHEYREKSDLQGKRLELSKTDAHYTYKAYVLEVIDGDTLWVEIDQGFKVLTVQKLRLRGINSAELSTSEGLNAKTYIQKQLKDCAFIAVKTHSRDKFDRYLTDIFYDENEPDLNRLVQQGKFLNQELLDMGLAVRYEG